MSRRQNMDKAHVRRAIAMDAASIAGIYNHHVEIGGSTFDTQPWTDAGVREMMDAPPPDAWFVAEVNDQIVGWASSRQYNTRSGYRYTCETAIYLHPDSTGYGIGHPLQTQLEQHCCAAGIHHAVAKIVSNNQRSISFHQRYGYQIVGIQKEIGHMNGNWCDVTIMQKIFT